MRKIIISLLTLTIFFSLLIFMFSCNKVYSEYFTNVTTYTLDNNGEFKILTLADTHFENDGSQEDIYMFARVNELITYSEPDLVIILGDMVYSDTSRIAALQVFADCMDTFDIPWACVYGNHDPENGDALLGITNRTNSIANKKAMNEILLASENCVFQVGPEDIDGFGNYYINITDNATDNNIIQTLFFLDSNDYVKTEDVNKYDFLTTANLTPGQYNGFIYPSQISWYEDAVDKITEYNNDDVVPSLAFFHIPLPEYKTAWNLFINESSEVTKLSGTSNEPNYGVGCPSVNTGMFEKMVELGSTKATFVGHDHANNYNISYKGIQLNYNGGMRLITYPVADSLMASMFGGRVVTIKADGTFTNEILLYDTIVS